MKNIETEIGTLLSAAAVAALLGVSRTTVSTLVRYGERFIPTRVGNTADRRET